MRQHNATRLDKNENDEERQPGANVRGDDGGYEELAAIGVLAGVGHGQQTLLGVLELEVLVGELVAVDALAAAAVAGREVATLDHEVLDDAVEARALVAEALLAGGQRAEVLGGLVKSA